MNQLEKKYESYSDEQLQEMTQIFKDKLQNGMKLEDLKIEAFAVVHETFATITVQNYFIMYKTLAGMTGSAMPSKQEFHETYNYKE